MDHAAVKISAVAFKLHCLVHGMWGLRTVSGTAAIFFLGLSGDALTTRKDFSFMGGFLTARILVAFVALRRRFFQVPALSPTVSAAFALLASGLFLYETSNIIQGGETIYVAAAVPLFVAIFNLFTSLLQLLGIMITRD